MLVIGVVLVYLSFGSLGCVLLLWLVASCLLLLDGSDDYSGDASGKSVVGVVSSSPCFWVFNFLSVVLFVGGLLSGLDESGVLFSFGVVVVSLLVGMVGSVFIHYPFSYIVIYCWTTSFMWLELVSCVGVAGLGEYLLFLITSNMGLMCGLLLAVSLLGVYHASSFELFVWCLFLQGQIFIMIGYVVGPVFTVFGVGYGHGVFAFYVLMQGSCLVFFYVLTYGGVSRLDWNLLCFCVSFLLSIYPCPMTYYVWVVVLEYAGWVLSMGVPVLLMLYIYVSLFYMDSPGSSSEVNPSMILVGGYLASFVLLLVVLTLLILSLGVVNDFSFWLTLLVLSLGVVGPSMEVRSGYQYSSYKEWGLIELGGFVYGVLSLSLGFLSSLGWWMVACSVLYVLAFWLCFYLWSKYK